MNNRNRRDEFISSERRSGGGVLDKDIAKKKKVAARVSREKATAEGSLPTRKFGRASSIASSIRSYGVDDDDDDEKDLKWDHNRPGSTNVTAVATPAHHGRGSSPRSANDTSDSDPYSSLRIAGGTPRRSTSLDNRSRYASLTIAANDSSSRPRIRGQRSLGVSEGRFGLNGERYVHLKVAARHPGNSSGGGGDEEVTYDSNASSSVSDGSRHGQGDDGDEDEEDLSDYGGDSGADDVDGNEFAGDNNYARVSVSGSENGERKNTKKFPGYAKDGDERYQRFAGYARVSVAGSDNEYRNDVTTGGSERGDGYARVSVAGSEIGGHGGDSYAKLSVAGSEAEQGPSRYRNTAGRYARISVAGSETDHDNDTYARISVPASKEHHLDNISPYARLTVVQGREDQSKAVELDDLKHAKGHLPPEKEEVPLKASEEKAREGQAEWSKAYETYMRLPPEERASLQYRVRVILISPLFDLSQRKLSAFPALYKSKFETDIEVTGFDGASSVCRVMSDIVERKGLEEDDKVLLLVDSAQNRRVVSGIRSGLRRIVYDALKSWPSFKSTCRDFEEKCSELLGKPLKTVLREHGYEKPSVETLVRDMLDIAGIEESSGEGIDDSLVYLCTGAQDPALTDGLLIRRSPESTPTKPVSSEDNIKLGVGEGSETAQGVGKSQAESLKIGSSVTLRTLKNELRRYGSFRSTLKTSSADDEVLNVRLRMRILLAFHNSGRGVELSELPEAYEKTFGKNLNVLELGFESVMELASCWQDMFLLQEPKPGWVFLVPSQANRRILNTLRTGLRSSVFSVLAEAYPNGLEPLEFLHRLQQGMSGELWEVLDAAGYICSSDAEKAESILSSSSSSDFQLVDFGEICVLLDDMMDFVRLGSNEDGSVVVKLKKGEVPLVDLRDCCNVEESDVESFDELFVNLMMMAVDVTAPSNQCAAADDDDGGSSESSCSALINVGHVQSLVKSFEGIGGLRSAHSQGPGFLRLKHEVRLILGCPQYFESGLTWSELSNVYTDRTGQELGSNKSKVKSILRAMPDIVCKDSLAEEYARLYTTPKNLRILSATRAGLRQVLFWASVKNPGGVWANLLEGWFTDFTGMSMAATLQMHGYEVSKSIPCFPVYVFLRDMSDLLHKKPAPYEVYTWAHGVVDPVHCDASLLGLSELIIQYDPLRVELEEGGPNSRGGARLIGDAVNEKSTVKEESVKGSKEAVAKPMVESCNVSEREEEAKGTAGGGGMVEDLELKCAAAKEEDKMNRNESSQGHAVDDEPATVEGQQDIAMTLHLGPTEAGDDFVSGFVEEVEKASGDQDIQSLHEGTVEREGVDGNIAGLAVKEEGADAFGEDIEIDDEEDDSNSEEIEEEEEEEDEEEDGEIHLPHNDRGETLGDDRALESNPEAYAQLRVASNAPKVNLDEWQFTDSEEGEEEDYDVDDDDDDIQDDGDDGSDGEEGIEGDEDAGDGDRDDDDDEDIDEGRDEEHNKREEDGKLKGHEHPKAKQHSITLSPPPLTGPKSKVTGKDNGTGWVLPNRGIPWK